MAERRFRHSDRDGGLGGGTSLAAAATAAAASTPAPASGAGGGGGGGNTSSNSGGNSSIKVAVRVRPLSETECTTGRLSATLITDSARGLVAIRSTDGTDQPKVFQFDQVFDQNASQREVFEAVARPVVDKALQGFNGAIIAYGQTGTGKTYTMEGDLMGDDEQIGIIPGVCRHIFEATAGTRSSVHVNYIEIYNEDLRDLLSERRDCIALRELAGGRLILGRDYKVESLDDITHLLQRGKANRAVAVTRNNESSSRSHAVFMLHYASTCAPPSSAGGGGAGGGGFGGGGVGGLGGVGAGGGIGPRCPARVVRSTLQLVDLAGSERLESQARNTEGTRLRESRKINKSLTALGLVISALAERKRHVPYRDSKLTRLLQDSLGGNSHTVLIATVSPAEAHRKETMCTLRYATGAKDVTNVVVRNESEMRLAAAAAAAAAASAFEANACLAWPNGELYWTPNACGGGGHRGSSGGWPRVSRRGASGKLRVPDSAKAATRMAGRASGRVGGRTSFPAGAGDNGMFERWWDSKRVRESVRASARGSGRVCNRASAMPASALRIVLSGGGVPVVGEELSNPRAGGGCGRNGATGTGGRRAYTAGRTGGGGQLAGKTNARARDKDKYRSNTACVDSTLSSDLDSVPLSVTSLSSRQLLQRPTTSRRTQTCSLYTGLEVPPPNTPPHCCVCLYPQHPQSAPAGWPPWLRLAPGAHGAARAAKLAVSLPALALPDDLPHIVWEKSGNGDCSSIEGIESASTNVQGSEHSYLSRSIVYLDGTSDSAPGHSPGPLATPLSTPRDNAQSPPSAPIQSSAKSPALHDPRCSMTCSLHCRRADGGSRGTNVDSGSRGQAIEDEQVCMDCPGEDVGEKESAIINQYPHVVPRDCGRDEGDVECQLGASAGTSQKDAEDYISQGEEDEERNIISGDECSLGDDGQVSYTQGTVISVVTTHRGSVAGDECDLDDCEPAPQECSRTRATSEDNSTMEEHHERLQEVEQETLAHGDGGGGGGEEGGGRIGEGEGGGLTENLGGGDATLTANSPHRCQSITSLYGTRWCSGGDADHHRTRPPETWHQIAPDPQQISSTRQTVCASRDLTPSQPPIAVSTGSTTSGTASGNAPVASSFYTRPPAAVASDTAATPFTRSSTYTTFLRNNGNHHSQQLETLDYVKKGVFNSLEDLESDVKCMYRNLNRRRMSMHSRPTAGFAGLGLSSSACDFPSARDAPRYSAAATTAAAKFAAASSHPPVGSNWWDRSTETLRTANNFRQLDPRKGANQTTDVRAPLTHDPLNACPTLLSQNPFYPSHPYYIRPLRRSLTQYT